MCAMTAPTRLETERMVLRPLRRSDAGWIAAGINDYDITRMMVRPPYPYGLADAEAFLDRMEAADGSRERAFAIESRSGGAIGVVGFHEQPLDWSPSGTALSPEVGYWLARDHWGHGLASEAVGAALSWAERTWKVRAVTSGHFADNPASGRVLEKAGFLYTGEVQRRPSIARGGEAPPTRMMLWLA